MFFTQASKHLAKLEILENKLALFEQMSRDMMSTLNNAVEKISEANQSIAKCLVSHDEKLKQTADNNQRTLEMIESLEKINKENHDHLEKKINSVEEKIDKNYTEINTKLADYGSFRGKMMGIGIVLTFIVGLGAVIVPLISAGMDLYMNTREHQIELYERKLKSENIK